jgi:hypothetical protein
MTELTMQQAQNLLYNTMNALHDAYKAALTVEQKDHIYAAMEVIENENRSVAQQIIASNTAKYKALTDNFKAAEQTLTEVKDKIQEWIKFVGTAAKVIDTIAKVLPLIAMV